MRTKPKPKPSAFGVSLRKLRLKKQFSLRQLAEMVGENHQCIDDLEMGRTQHARLDLSMALARALTAKLEETNRGTILESVYPSS